MVKKQAIILCSGGLDSVTLAHHIRSSKKYDGHKMLFFNYGQKSLKTERKFSKECSKKLGAEFIEFDISQLGSFSKSLINKNTKPKNKTGLKDTKNESEQWYVPGRNIIFLSYALSYAESISNKNKKSEIFIGFKNEGNEGYPDTSKSFVTKMNSVGKEGLSQEIKIKAPFIDKDKEDIIDIGTRLGLDYSKTFSCYENSEIHCGDCLACRLRKAGFKWAGIKDPTNYWK